MYIKRSHYRAGSFVSRHFSHKAAESGAGGGDGGPSGGSECPGESDLHQKMKSIAYARLDEDYPDVALELEGHVDGRFADVLLTFPEPRSPYGRGIAVEAQYRNKGKDIEAVTEHYFEHSYSVAWLEEADFTSHDVDLSGIHTLWPHALPNRRGASGYPAVTQSLWNETNPPVKREIPIPGAYWASYDKSGEWITIAEKRLRTRGSVQLSKSPTGNIVFGVSKGTPSGGKQVQVQASPSDVATLRSFADDLDRIAFGSERPPPQECDPKWHELAHVWLHGSDTVTSWLKASLPTPTSTVVLQLGKKQDGSSATISMQIQPFASDSFWLIAGLLEDVFEIENGS